MKKLFISDTTNLEGQEVTLYGWVHTIRDHKKVVFIDLRDKSGILQCVGDSSMSTLSSEDAICISGTIKNRPAHMHNEKILTGKIELQVKSFEIIQKSRALPFEINGEKLDLQLPTLLDWRPITLKNSNVTNVFKVQASVAEGFRIQANKMKCLEVFTPTIASGASEGGTEVFPIKYYDHDAFLVQSPQLYKQMLIPSLERVFMISKIYRAEPSVTTRHLAESTQMDCEFGFVDFSDLLDILEEVGTQTIQYVTQQNPQIFADVSPLANKKVPRLTLQEALDLIFEKTGRDIRREPDLDPEGEKFLCEWSKQTHESDFVTITHFPMSKRPFYTMADPENPKLSLSYDLLYRGVEVLSGAQRVHSHDDLIIALKAKGLNPENFQMYLQAFAYGMPTHGGFSFGLERLTMKLMNLENVREASLFPRDMERIDMRLTNHS